MKFKTNYKFIEKHTNFVSICQHNIGRKLLNMVDVWEDSEGEFEEQIKRIVSRIREERERARLSQMDLSLTAGLSQNLINYIENGRRTPNLYTILKICKALQIEPASLFADSDAERSAARETIINLVNKYV
jgi:DNA-binding XRE family transcriptional regulator